MSSHTADLAVYAACFSGLSTKCTPGASRSSRFGSELPSVEDDVDVWRYAIVELHATNDENEPQYFKSLRISVELKSIKYCVVHIFTFVVLRVKCCVGN